MSISKISRVPEVKGALEEYKRDALNAIGISIAGGAKERSPVQDGVLRASISWAIDGGSPQYPQGEQVQKNDTHPEGSQAVNRGVKAPPNSVIIGSNVDYAREQHENMNYKHTKTIQKGSNKGQQVQVGEAKFIENAANEFRPRILPTVKRALKGELR